MQKSRILLHSAAAWAYLLLFNVLLLVSGVYFADFSLFMPKVTILLFVFAMLAWLVTVQKKNLSNNQGSTGKKALLSSSRKFLIDDLGYILFFFFSYLIGKWLEPDLFFLFTAVEILLLYNLYLSYLSSEKDLLAKFERKIIPKIAASTFAITLFLLFQLYLLLRPQAVILSQSFSFKSFLLSYNLLISGVFLSAAILSVHRNEPLWHSSQSAGAKGSQSALKKVFEKTFFPFSLLILSCAIGMLLKHFTNLDFYTLLLFALTESILICNIILSFFAKGSFHAKTKGAVE